MKTNLRNYHFVDSQSDNVIAYFSIRADLDELTIKKELEKERNKLASQRGVFVETIYWKEIKD